MCDNTTSAAQAGYIRDADCTVDTPVLLGFPQKSVYGTGKCIEPRLPGKHGTPYEKKIYLEALLPLEEYDLIAVLFSGGKDSMAAYWVLRELGVPKEKISLWHHDIDGGHPTRTMDWPVTQAYIQAFARAEQISLCTSWRVNGFFGELYRIGASYPIAYDDGRGAQECRLSENQLVSRQLRREVFKGLASLDELKTYGYRMKFPAKSGDLSRRWCSAYLKIDVADTVIRNLNHLADIGSVNKFPAKNSIHGGRWCSPQLKGRVADSVIREINALGNGRGQLFKILLVSGERRGESAGRSKYNEIEVHRTNATAKSKRLVHQWRPVIDFSERDVWEVIRRHGITPHPCYAAGWNRCSCKMCIFGLPKHWAGIRELFPKDYYGMLEDEKRLAFTIDNKKDLESYIGDAKSCVVYSNPRAIEQLVSGCFGAEDVYTTQQSWFYPAGAFKGSVGGPC